MFIIVIIIIILFARNTNT